MKLFLKYKATISYIILILISNLLFGIFPPIAVFGKQTLSPADAIIGVIYITRDFAQREIQSYVLLAMLCGGLLSYFFTVKEVAFASLCAFFVGEFIEWMIFTWTKKPLSQRLLWSSMCSCPIDTVIFLGLIHRLNIVEFTLMCSFKLLGILFVWAYWRRRNENQVVIA